VLVPNASEAERQRLPGAGVDVRLSWDPDHIHLVRESRAASFEREQATASEAASAA
jgi:hypothetical protein